RILWARSTEVAMAKESVSSRRKSLMTRSGLLLLDGHFRSLLQLAGDGGVGAGDDFRARLEAAASLDEGVVGDPGLDLLHVDGLALPEEEAAPERQALRPLLLLLDALVGDVGAILAVILRRLHALLLLLLG